MYQNLINFLIIEKIFFVHNKGSKSVNYLSALNIHVFGSETPSIKPSVTVGET